MSNVERCLLCNGTRAEHGPDIQHAFSIVPGELKTKAQLKKENEAPRQGMVMMAQPPPRDTVERLVMLLLDKGVISQEDALYVSLGRRPSQ